MWYFEPFVRWSRTVAWAGTGGFISFEIWQCHKRRSEFPSKYKTAALQTLFLWQRPAKYFKSRWPLRVCLWITVIAALGATRHSTPADYRTMEEQSPLPRNWGIIVFRCLWHCFDFITWRNAGPTARF